MPNTEVLKRLKQSLELKEKYIRLKEEIETIDWLISLEMQAQKWQKKQ